MTGFLIACIALAVGWTLGAIVAQMGSSGAATRVADVSDLIRRIVDRRVPSDGSVATTLVTPPGINASVDPDRAETIFDNLVATLRPTTTRMAAVVEVTGDRVKVTIAHDGDETGADETVASTRSLARALGGDVAVAHLAPRGRRYTVSLPVSAR